MIKTVRLDEATRERLERASQALGVTHSEFIRSAVERQCGEVLDEGLSRRIRPALGRIRSGGGRARRTGESYRRLLRSGTAES